ncbi:hypothetical protein KFL_013220010, partial [Klebsormidium nitens]
MDRFKLLRFYTIRRLSEEFLDVYGAKPLESLTFLLQVIDRFHQWDITDIGRASYRPVEVHITREILSTLGLAHPLDHEHISEPLETLAPKLLVTKYFKEYDSCVHLFDTRAKRTLVDVRDRKAVTHALNHIFKKMGLRISLSQAGRETSVDPVTEKRARIYEGWQVEYDPRGMLGVKHMAQLLKLQ